MCLEIIRCVDLELGTYTGGKRLKLKFIPIITSSSLLIYQYCAPEHSSQLERMATAIPLTDRFFLFGNCNIVPDRYDDV